MTSGTGLSDTEQAGMASVASEPIPGIFRGIDLTPQSDSLYDLDSSIPDVIGLCAGLAESNLFVYGTLSG